MALIKTYLDIFCVICNCNLLLCYDQDMLQSLHSLFFLSHPVKCS